MKCRQLRNGLLNLLLILVFVNSSQVNKLQEEHQHQVLRHDISHAIHRSERHEVSHHNSSIPLGAAAKQAITRLPCLILLAAMLFNNDYYSLTPARGINNIVKPAAVYTPIVDARQEAAAVETPVVPAPWENHPDDIKYMSTRVSKILQSTPGMPGIIADALDKKFPVPKVPRKLPIKPEDHLDMIGSTPVQFDIGFNEKKFRKTVENNVYAYPYTPIDINPKMILDLLENPKSDGLALANLKTLIPELFSHPDQAKNIEGGIQARAKLIQDKLNKMMKKSGYTVVAYAPIERSSDPGSSSTANPFSVLHSDMSHQNELMIKGRNPERIQSSLPPNTFVDKQHAESILGDDSLVLAGSLNIWYTRTSKNEVLPLAVANANTADGKYYAYSQYTKSGCRFRLRNINAAFGLGLGFFGNPKEVMDRLRFWTVPIMHYGYVFIFNTIQNPHVAVDIEDAEDRNKGEHRTSDEVRVMLFCKKGDPRCDPAWSMDLHSLRAFQK